jgi:hypothetical protein
LSHGQWNGGADDSCLVENLKDIEMAFNTRVASSSSASVAGIDFSRLSLDDFLEEKVERLISNKEVHANWEEKAQKAMKDLPPNWEEMAEQAKAKFIRSCNPRFNVYPLEHDTYHEFPPLKPKVQFGPAMQRARTTPMCQPPKKKPVRSWSDHAMGLNHKQWTYPVKEKPHWNPVTKNWNQATWPGDWDMCPQDYELLCTPRAIRVWDDVDYNLGRWVTRRIFPNGDMQQSTDQGWTWRPWTPIHINPWHAAYPRRIPLDHSMRRNMERLSKLGQSGPSTSKPARSKPEKPKVEIPAKVNGRTIGVYCFNNYSKYPENIVLNNGTVLEALPPKRKRKVTVLRIPGGGGHKQRR